MTTTTSHQLNLPPDVLSKQDLKALITEVKKYAKWFSQTSVKLRYDQNAASDQPTLSAAASQLINDWASDQQLTQAQLDDLITALTDFEDTAPIMTITLAAPAPNKLKHSLIDWCRANIKPDILVNFKFNATILGGMVISYDSHTYDWSFRQKILNNRQKFAEILRNV